VAPARPYVQAGLFAVPGNAERLVRRLEQAGLPALARPARLATGPATRVLSGPFATAAERDAARRRIQSMGLADAVPVAR
jgi:cell division protein FtsN